MALQSPRLPVPTGIVGLDDVLRGGLPAHRLHLLQGAPGTGKTTMALQFLRTGVAAGERALLISLSESVDETRAAAASHGWSLDGIDVYEMTGEDLTHAMEEENTLYVPAEVELGDRMRRLLDEIERVKPQRLVLDSCSELRLMAQTSLRFRRQILALKREIVQRGCTAVLIENPLQPTGDPLLQSLVHGVIELDHSAPIYGTSRRRLRVLKMREVAFRGGYHDVQLRRGSFDVLPRLVAAEHHATFDRTPQSTGIGELDALLGGGIDPGTGILISGPAGSGKSAIALQMAVAAAQRGDNAAMFLFEEGLGTLYSRARALGIDLEPQVESGRITIRQIDPVELTPGEFAHLARRAVEDSRAKIVVIDSLNGYLHAAPEEAFVTAQLHELLSYLRQCGAVTILIAAHHGLMGPMQAAIDVSYLTDTLILTRFFEARGRVRKAVSVVKRRSGGHEDTIREFAMSARGITVGPPLAQFRGVLTGVPELDPAGAGELLPDTQRG